MIDVAGKCIETVKVGALNKEELEKIESKEQVFPFQKINNFVLFSEIINCHIFLKL